LRDQLKAYIDEGYLIGRKLIINEILNFLQDDHLKVLHVHGQDGQGKTDIVNHAARYAIRGRAPIEKAIYEDGSKTTVERLI
jgi:hypothetical protein